MPSKKHSINFGLDYDDTYTVDPDFWDQFIVSAQKRGHVVYLTTMRFKPTPDMEQVLRMIPERRQVFCGSSMKKDKCKSLSIHIDIWIDDQPVFIG